MTDLTGTAGWMASEGVAMHDARAREFEAFVAKHRERTLGLAWRLVGGDRATAEDVAHDAFVRAHRALDRFRGEAEMSTWFHRIVINEARRHRRWLRLRRRFSAAMPEDVAEASAEPRGDPALRDRILRALDRLSNGQREAFILVHLERHTVSEAASMTGRALGTTKAHLHRALTNLRRELADLAPAREVTS